MNTTTPANEFEATWNEGEDNSHDGSTARALIAKRKADEAVTRDDFVSSFKTQTADPLDIAESGPSKPADGAVIPADAAGHDVDNTAVDKVKDDADEGVATEITKAAA